MDIVSKRRPAFTLIELIIVIAVIAILAAAIFVAIDPARRLQEARNARRSSDIATILEGVKKYQADNASHYSTVAAITAGEFVIIGTTTNDDGLCTSEASSTLACANTATATGTADCVDLSAIGGTYLGAVPTDPQNGSAADTSYYISRGSSNQITVGSCDEEGEGAGGAGAAPTLEVTR